MSSRQDCFCGRREVFEFGLTDDDGNAHTWDACGSLHVNDLPLDINELLSQKMKALERAEKAEAAIHRVRELLEYPRDYRGNGSEWNECRAAVLRALDGEA